MKKINYILGIALVTLMSSCIDDEEVTGSIAGGTNVIGFVEPARNIGSVANTGAFEFEFPVHITGPSIENLSGSFTATIEVDPSSTAVAGTHYNLPTTQFTLTSDGDLNGTFVVEMLSDGIVTTPENPLPSPSLILNVVAVDGSGKIVASGKSLNLTLDYLCNATLGVEYVATHVREDGYTNVHNDLIEETGLEVYRTESIERWGDGNVAPLGAGGFEFLNVCNVITIPDQILMDYYGNEVKQAGKSEVLENGNIHFEYSIAYGGVPYGISADYVLNP